MILSSTAVPSTTSLALGKGCQHRECGRRDPSKTIETSTVTTTCTNSGRQQLARYLGMPPRIRTRTQAIRPHPRLGAFGQVEPPFAIRRQFFNGLPKNWRSEEHTSELQSHSDLVCRLLLE